MIATHNIEFEKFMKVLERKCFICPSVSLTTENNALSNIDYGEITVLFNDDIIDPTINKNALLLSGDGYTSTVNLNGTNHMSNKDLALYVKQKYFNNESFMYFADEQSCKSAAAVPITMEEAKDEIYRIVSVDEYKNYKDNLIDIYEEFLDKNFKGWDWTDTAQKYLYETPYLIENSITPNVELGLKNAIKECAKCNSIEAKQDAIKESCKKYGLKVTPKKINNIIDYAEKMRYAPVVYFEDKIFQDVSLSNIKCLIIPDYILDKIEDKLLENNIQYKTYDTQEKRKELILEHSNKEKTLDKIIDSAKNRVNNTMKNIDNKELER